MRSQLRVCSLFSGIGGLDLGLERAGMKVVSQCEIDPYCRRVLAKHWPDVLCHDDVTTREFVEGEADVVCGGFPCQDVSNAGKRAGLSAPRSGLYRELVRAIRMVRPKYAVLENVAALLGGGLDTVLGDLAEVGYGAAWDCLPASYVGAPHIRDRVFIVAYADQNGRDLGILSKRRLPEERQSQFWEPFRATDFRVRVQELARVCGLDDGVPQELGAYGNAVVPQVAEVIGRAVVAHYESETSKEGSG